MLNAELEAVRLMTDRLLEKVNDEHREEKKALINEHEVVRLQMKAEVDIANIQGELAIQHWEFDFGIECGHGSKYNSFQCNLYYNIIQTWTCENGYLLILRLFPAKWRIVERGYEFVTRWVKIKPLYETHLSDMADRTLRLPTRNM